MYRSVAGIAPAANGYNAVRIAPQIVRGLGPTKASATLSTVRGPATVSWDATASKSISIDATIPAGATGTVSVPTLGTTAASVVITEGGHSVWEHGAFVPGTAGVLSGKLVGGSIEFNVSSGHYSFGCNC